MQRIAITLLVSCALGALGPSRLQVRLKIIYISEQPAKCAESLRNGGEKKERKKQYLDPEYVIWSRIELGNHLIIHVAIQGFRPPR